jgi:hypothetical protein
MKLILLFFNFIVFSSQYKFETIKEQNIFDKLHVYEEKDILKDVLSQALDLQVQNSNSTDKSICLP